MIATLQPSTIMGQIHAPASKSSMQRACALALLNKGITKIINPGKSNDDLAALDIIQRLGATVEIEDQELLIKNEGTNIMADQLNCGESGLAIRMFTPIAALSTEEISITGEGSLLKRPMHFFDEVFPRLGVVVQTNDGYLPIKIKGPLQPADITIDGSLSSQFLTGLLLAFGKAATKPFTISVTDLTSKPYIDLTLQLMKEFGYPVSNDNYERFTIHPSLNSDLDLHQTPSISLKAYTVEGDWSGAAFLLVAGAIAGRITVTGLDVFSTQADKAVLKALIDCGVNISIEEKQILVNEKLGNNGKAFHFNASDCPDLFPPLAALAAYCKGTSVIEGVGRLIHKESNRALSLQEEFGKMGIEIKLQDDLMMISGGNVVKGAKVSAHHDHRIAMACAVAALGADGPVVIDGAEAVSKSYPDFFADLKLLNANVSLPINE